MRDPLKEPKYGDVFEWASWDGKITSWSMYLCDDGPTYWIGLEIPDGEVVQHVDPRILRGWRVVEAAP